MVRENNELEQKVQNRSKYRGDKANDKGGFIH